MLRKQPLSSANVAVPSAGLAAGAVAGHGKGSLYSSDPAVQCAAGVGMWAMLRPWCSSSYRGGRMLQ